MTELFETIQHMAIPTWVRESPSIFAYTFILSAHAIGLAIVVGISSMIALRMAGIFRDFPVDPMLKLMPVAWTGFTINAISGVLLLSANMTGMLSNPMFYFKMFFILIAMIAVSMIRRQFLAGKAESSRGLAWVILVTWFLAIVSGRLTSYPYLVQSWFA